MPDDKMLFRARITDKRTGKVEELNVELTQAQYDELIAAGAKLVPRNSKEMS